MVVRLPVKEYGVGSNPTCAANFNLKKELIMPIRCTSCGEEKEEKWFAPCFVTGNHQKYPVCRKCKQDIYDREIDKRKAYQVRYFRTRKQRVVDYLGGRCKVCGYNKCIGALTAHHRDPSVKSFTISTHLHKPWEILQPELDKCDLVCERCHIEYHYENPSYTRPIAEKRQASMAAKGLI